MRLLQLRRRVTRIGVAALIAAVICLTLGCDFIVGVRVQNDAASSISVVLNDRYEADLAAGEARWVNMQVNEELHSVRITMHSEPAEQQEIKLSSTDTVRLIVEGPPLSVRRVD